MTWKNEKARHSMAARGIETNKWNNHTVVSPKFMKDHERVLWTRSEYYDKDDSEMIGVYSVIDVDTGEVFTDLSYSDLKKKMLDKKYIIYHNKE